jgi:hypothetical protein
MPGLGAPSCGAWGRTRPANGSHRRCRAADSDRQNCGSACCCAHELLPRGYVSIRSTHWARQALASKGSAKYCVSRATLSPLNSMMLTV